MSYNCVNFIIAASARLADMFLEVALAILTNCDPYSHDHSIPRVVCVSPW